MGTPTVNTKETAQQAERDNIERIRNPAQATARKEKVATFGVFAKEFMSTYVLANDKPSEQRAKQNILHVWLLPRFKSVSLDAIKRREIETLKATMLEMNKPAKLINKTLTVLGKVLRYATELKLIDSAPRIVLLRVPPQTLDFLNFDELERLLEGAKSDSEIRAAILCGADAGLRPGEIKGLDWGDLDFKAGLLCVKRSLHRGIVSSPKSGRERTVPMTERLRGALRDLRHQWCPAVFCNHKGERYTAGEMNWRLKKVCRQAHLRWIGWHGLRHTFCSHLAMRGAPPSVVQQLAEHPFTQRCMSLTPGAAWKAIRMLETGAAWPCSVELISDGKPEGAD